MVVRSDLRSIANSHAFLQHDLDLREQELKEQIAEQDVREFEFQRQIDSLKENNAATLEAASKMRETVCGIMKGT